MKFIIVPHTHWDREWYFTNSVSDSLLKFNLNNLLSCDDLADKYYLDGQVSLLEDYLSTATAKNKQKIIELIQQKKIVVGPFYSQPDVFNSLGETTIRNIEIAKKYLEDNNLPNNPVFYCPDTFGFGFNLPQIMDHLNFKYFVFWRGLGHNEANNDLYNWVGPNHSKIKSYRLKYGYWTFSSIFPWMTLNEDNLIVEAKKCLETFKTSKQFTHYQNQENDGVAVIPFGGDQAPYHPLTKKFIKTLNELDDNEWVIGDYTDFLEKQEPTQTIEGTLDLGYESKIHRTIGSTRYDFKKIFRDNEIYLYHQLEPLQLFYKHLNNDYEVENDRITKHLLCMQAHDILGGCVTDNAYLSSIQKMYDMQDEMNAKKNIILKQLSCELNLKENELLIFNPNVNNKVENWFYYDVYTSENINDTYEDEKVIIFKVASCINKQVDKTIKSTLLIINKTMQPLSYHNVDLNMMQVKEFAISNNVNTNSFTNFIIQNDNGDLFDADPSSEKATHKTNVDEKTLIKLSDEYSLVKINGNIEINNKYINNFEITALITSSEETDIKITIKNSAPDIIIKWVPNIKLSNITFSQHLGIDSYKRSAIENWKELGYSEYPMNVEKQSGLIFGEENYICSKATNEFVYDGNELTITLFRSTGMLGKANLKTRPGTASGIDGYHIETPLGQLLDKTLEFNFRYGKINAPIHDYLNTWFKTLICFQSFSKDVIANGIERFIFTKKKTDLSKNIEIKFPEGFISCSRIEGDKITLRAVDFEKDSTNFNKIVEITKKYE
ncbi:MAG: hypothetical protein ACRC42_02875 [Mycoplasma sp.]